MILFFGNLHFVTFEFLLDLYYNIEPKTFVGNLKLQCMMKFNNHFKLINVFVHLEVIAIDVCM